MLRVKQILERETDETHSITMTQLLEFLNDLNESDRRTLYDDIRKLDYLGTKVKIDKSKTPPHLSVTDRLFSISELKLMIDAIASSKYLTRDASQQLINKLKTFCSRYEAAQLTRHTLLANRAKRIDTEFHNNVGIISQAIDEKKKISFDYFRINTKYVKQYNRKPSIVSPWETVYVDENYYMVAYDANHQYGKDKKKHYRIDRMSNIQILDEPQEGADEYKKFKEELPFRTQASFNLFGGEKEYVTLRCPKYFFYIIQDKFGADVLAHPDGEGNITVNVPVAVGPQFFGWVFSMGKIITIMEPQNVKEQYYKMLNEAASPYYR